MGFALKASVTLQHGLLHELFSSTARAHPDRIAIEVPPGFGRPARVRLSYAEVEAAATALATRLRPLVPGECIVAIKLPRTTPDLYIAQLAALKAGAGFTCIDPAFPPERAAEILDDSGAVALLESADAGGIAVIPLGAAAAKNHAPGPLSLAYVIYTSGTSGRPKGVMIEHAAITNLVISDMTHFGLGPEDRVVQGSSAAYDSSLEEIWLAFAVGATLLVMDDQTARLGPDLVSWLRAERATVFCPPPTLLRSTGCSDPAAALPDLRLLYVGGEALPLDIAAAWSQGRRMVNGYGPTECTVTCLRADIVPGQQVAIGVPVSGASAWALDETGAEVADGAKGELHIGGAGLARGYWRSPELTAQKFVQHPQLGRIYRTGDLVHREADGLFYYHGRIDSQVKLRGYRIELGEIEQRLVACAGVRAAGCRVQEADGTQALTAFVVAEDPSSAPTEGALKEALAQSLPGYMIPRRIALLAALPVTIGGKLDRDRLPLLAVDSSASTDLGTRPRDAMEARIEAAFADILKRARGVSVLADFFDLGGDSLSAAMVVTLLRDDPATDWITVSDIYEARSVAELAKLAEKAASEVHAEAPRAFPIEGQKLGLSLAVQAAWLLTVVLLSGTASWFISFELLPRLMSGLGLVGFILLSPLLAALGFALYTPVMAILAIALKRLLIGRYQPMRTPVWSTYYLRHWVVQQTVRLLPWRMLEGTSAQQAILRGLGAKIGQRVHIHRGVDLRRGGWDLLEIGDDATLSQEAMVRLTELDRGELIIGPVTIGAGATLETRAGVSSDTVVGADACLMALSSLSSGERIPAGEVWDGVPACRIGKAPIVPAVSRPSNVYSPALHGMLTLAAEGLLAMVVALPAELAAIAACWLLGIDSWALWRWLYHPTADPRLWALLLAITVLSVPVTVTWSAMLSRGLGRVRPGVISRWSLGYIRIWLKTGLLIRASEWLSGTVFWPMWLRLAGMRVGKGSEISTILDVVPELVEIGSGTFFADGIYLGGPRIQHGTVTLDSTELGRNTFLGNHVVIRAGQHLPDDILIGISTPADATRIRPGSAWFGHPSFELPRREVVEVDRSLTHEPSLIRYIDRLFWEALRFTLPVGPLLLTIAWFAGVSVLRQHLSGPAFFLLGLPLVTFAAAAALCAAVLGVKWGLLGRVKPGQHPLWSCWCSRWDFFYVVWGKYARHILELLEGTLYLNGYLRLIGMRIGKRVVLGPGFAQVVDPDMLILGDDATVTTIFQAHTFEDRVLKIDYVTVGAGATLSPASVPLYGAMIGEGCWVGAHSVIMKQEHLPAWRRYQGVPARN
ncbi:amino acid adenylation domain-containing protein [Sphingomonas sp.]|uniref:amino acid adenylation domain-containing protein n=1 Tax=Sphingomonas sp. TaxID=28214 RepID=UPI00334264DC